MYDPSNLMSYLFKFSLYGIHIFRDGTKNRGIGDFSRFPVYSLHNRSIVLNEQDHINCTVSCVKNDIEADEHCVSMTPKWRHDWDEKDGKEDNISKRIVWQSWAQVMLESKCVLPLIPRLSQKSIRQYLIEKKGFELTIPIMVSLLRSIDGGLKAKSFKAFEEKGWSKPWDDRAAAKKKEESNKQDAAAATNVPVQAKMQLYVESGEELKQEKEFLTEKLRQPRGLGGDLTNQVFLFACLTQTYKLTHKHPNTNLKMAFRCLMLFDTTEVAQLFQTYG
jgi:hypothetical protein